MAQPRESPSLMPTTLETLPAELRLNILLSISDLADLKAVVHASPVLHQQYLLDRKRILGHVLKKTLGSVFADAQALQAAASLGDFGKDVPVESIREILQQHIDEYVARRSDPDIVTECGVDDLAAMASFYLSVIQPLLVGFPALFLQGLDASMEVGHLSKTERIRFLRALYRFQLFYDLFKCETTRVQRDPLIPCADKLGMFFTIFEPYEVEEVYCLFSAMADKYLQLVDVVTPDVQKDRPEFNRVGLVGPPGAFNPASR
jgi:hypothetical protein